MSKILIAVLNKVQTEENEELECWHHSAVHEIEDGTLEGYFEYIKDSLPTQEDAMRDILKVENRFHTCEQSFGNYFSNEEFDKVIVFLNGRWVDVYGNVAI